MTRADELQAIIDSDPINDRLHRQLVELVTRWRIEDDPPSAGRAFNRRLIQDYIGTIRDFFRLDERDQQLLAAAYIAHNNQCVNHVSWPSTEALIAAWGESVVRIERDHTAAYEPQPAAT